MSLSLTMRVPMSNHSLSLSRAPYKRRIFRRSSGWSPLRAALTFLMLVLAGAAGAYPVLAATATPAPHYVQTESAQTAIALDVNNGTMLRLPRAANAVFVANPEIADVQLKSPKLMFVHGDRDRCDGQDGQVRDLKEERPR